MKRILIVDDHPDFRAHARRLLARRGYSVVGEADNGATALTAIGRARPDVVLVDVYLGDANGFDLAEQIATHHPDTKVVITSGSERGTFTTRLRRTSALGFLSKTDLAGGSLEVLLAIR